MGRDGLLPVTSDLCLLLGELHVVKDAEDDSEEVVPPMLLEGVAVALHNLEHDRETPVGGKDKRFTLHRTKEDPICPIEYQRLIMDI